MPAHSVYVIETGVANIASMLAALQRVGAAPELTRSPTLVREADWVVLPGVGAFGAGMLQLRQYGLFDALRKRFENKYPTLAVCLGLQLMCRSSEESPGVEGLGILPVDVQRFPKNVRVPHFGWNHVEADPRAKLLKAGYAYFANSYRVVEAPTDWVPAYTQHGDDRFVSAVESGPVLGCQFHPELSGEWGMHLLKSWLGQDA